MDKDIQLEFNNLNKSLKAIGSRFVQIDSRFAQMDDRFDELFQAIGYFSDKVEQRFTDIEHKIINLPDKEYIDRKFAAFAKANNLILRDDSGQEYSA